MSQCSCKNCDLEVFENSDKCILHCEKDSNFSNAELFLQKIIRLTFQKTVLENIVFPSVDTEDLNRFKKEKVTFKQCKFQGKITGNKGSITPVLEFIECEFDSLILWEDLIIENEISFKDSIFKDDCINNGCTFNKKVDLDGVIYKSVADFAGSTFKEIVKQKYTSYDGYAVFRDVTFEKPLNLRDTLFNHKVNFLNIRKNEKVDVANRETARIMKDSFEQQNNIIEANKFYALEMKEREKELDKDVKEGKNIFEWLVFKIHGLASNHSQDWTLSLLWIILISCIVTVFNQTYFYETDRYLFISLITTIPIGFAVFTKELIQKISLLIFTFIFIQFNAINWDFLANQLNPFSIMTGKEHLTFSGLIYKVIIAYLIYQLIISIRQNTRRK
ncbi:MAG: hypothetical protein AB7D96_08255 [Arcobacteraceae bacterium]